MDFVLVHQIRPKARGLSAEGSRIYEASRRPKFGVLHVVVDELESVHRADLDLRRERIALIRFPRIELAAEIPYRDAKCERPSGFERELRPEIHGAGALDFRADAGALPRAIDAQLDQLVVDP